jgi:hypothetical protein
MSNRRMYVQGEFAPPESERTAAERLMRSLDDQAAKNGMAVTGDVEILTTKPSLFAVPRQMYLEADVVPR